MNVSTKHQDSFQSLVKGLQVHLLARNYSADTLRHYRHVWIQLARYADNNGISIVDDDEWINRFLREHYNLPDEASLSRTQKTYLRAARMLQDFQKYGHVSRRSHTKRELFPERYDSIFDSADMYCIRKNLKETTKRQFNIHVRKFVSFLESRELGVAGVRAAHLQEFILTLTSLGRPSIAFTLYVLRSVLSVAFEKGHTAADLSLLVPTVRVQAGAKIQAVYPTEDIQAILHSVDRQSPMGKRDYAILLLATQLGMRVGDIRELKFSNLHWSAREIQFSQNKTNNANVLPLSEELGWAIIDYIRSGRPVTDSKHLFVRHVAPYDAFGSENNLNNLVNKYFRAAKVKIPSGKHHGMHIFRHSLASTMLAEGTPLPVISEVLGHSDTNTTKRYLKIDVKQLRNCALEVNFNDTL